MPTIRVKQGDSLSSIEETYGIPWEKIWNHSNNQDLKTQREDPNILMPGDQIYVPDREQKDEACSDGSKHSFRLLREKPTLRLCLRIRSTDGEEITIANEDYELHFDEGETKTGITDDDGNIEEDIPANARNARVLIQSRNLMIPLSLGRVDPIDETSGLQSRLNMLGYPCGAVDGKMGPVTKNAVKQFQKDQDLTVDGIPGQQTRGKLKEVFGS